METTTVVANASAGLYIVEVMNPPPLEELSAYRAYDEQLGQQLESFKRLRHQVRLFPVCALLTGVPVGVFTEALYGAGVVLVWLIIWVSTLYITSMRSWQFKAERKRIHAEVQELERQVSASRATVD